MIKINADEIHFALSFMKDIIPDDNHMDIWRYVKLSTKDGKLTVQGISGAKQGICTVPYISSDSNYTFVLLLAQLHSLVSQYKKVDDVIELEPVYKYDELRSVQVRNSYSNVNVSVAELDSYPEITFPKQGIGTVVPSEFTKLLGLAAYADRQLSTFQKVHLFTQDNLMYVEATDTYCGGKGEVELSTALNIDVAVLPDLSYILNKMAKLALDDEQWTVFLPDDINMFFVSGEYWTIGVAIHNGAYPDTQNIYKNSNINYIELDKAEVKQCVSSIAPVIDNNKIRIKIKNNKVTFECPSGKSEIEGTFEQQDNETIVSLYNLQKILGSVKSKSVIFQIGVGTAEPLVIYDDDITYYTLPYRR